MAKEAKCLTKKRVFSLSSSFPTFSGAFRTLSNPDVQKSRAFYLQACVCGKFKKLSQRKADIDKLFQLIELTALGGTRAFGLLIPPHIRTISLLLCMSTSRRLCNYQTVNYASQHRSTLPSARVSGPKASPQVCNGSQFANYFN